MSINEKQTINKKNNNENVIKIKFFSSSSKNSLSSNQVPDKNNQDSFSEDNSKINDLNDPIKYNTNFSTTFQTSQIFKQNSTEEVEEKESENENENEKTLGERLSNILRYNSTNSENSNQISKKPRLSLKDSRTKIKQLRDELYPLSFDEKIHAQEELLPVPYEKMNDEKYKILKMHNLKRPSLPEYKSCEKYEDYYKPFEDSLNKKNEYYLLKNKKSVYSNTKVMKLEINLKNKNMEKKFPLFKDQDIGVYEYWQVPLIESKIDEDNDSDDEQINLAKKVCEMDLTEGIKYIQKNGINSIYNEKFKEKKKENNKSISV